jgi:TolB protein
MSYAAAGLLHRRASARESAAAQPNGLIAFVSNRNGIYGDIYVMNPDGSNQRNLTNSSTSEVSPAFSPDGKRIAFLRDWKTLQVMNADGSNQTQLFDGARAGFQTMMSPDWSPDGRKIAFSGIRSDDLNNQDVYVIGADGTGLTRLTTDPADDTSPRFSPDGARIAFSSIRDRVPNEVNYEIYVMNADGSGQTRVTNNTKFDHGPAWSPDGTRIAFTSRRDDNFEVYVMNADGSGQTRLTVNGEQDSDPEWSPDGTRIAFLSSRDGRFGEIYTMKPDGTDLVNLTNAEYFDMDPSWQRLAAYSPAPTPTPTPAPTPAPPGSLGSEVWEPFIPSSNQVELDVLTCGGRSFAKVKITFSDGGYRVTDWGQVAKSGNELNADFKAERWTGGSIQVITFAESVYDLGALAPGTYTFTLNSRGTFIKSKSFVIGSASSASSNPVDDASVFVWQHYLDFLGRDPDAQGFRFWTQNMTNGCGTDAACIERKRVNTSAAFFLSIEFQRTGFLVHRLYRASYGRMPRRAEFMPDARTVARDVVVGKTGWEDLLNANTRAFVDEWVMRPDFKFNFDQLSDSQFVDRLVANAGITLAPGARDSLVADLGAGKQTRAEVLRTIAEDEGFRRKESGPAFVLMQYFGYLQRDPDKGRDANMDGFNYWLSKLDQFSGDYVRAEMVKAFVNSDEYRARFCAQ